MHYLFARLRAVLVTLVMAGMAAAAQDTTSQPAIADRLEQLQQQQAELLARLNDLQKEINALQEEQRRRDAEVKPPATVTVGSGRLKVDGLLQQWFTAASSGLNSGFLIRRAEIKLSGEIRPDVRWTIMVDPAKPLVLTTTSMGDQSVATGVYQGSRILKDAFLSYTVTPSLTVSVGQQKIPLSMLGLRSSAQLPTVERPLMTTLPYDRGRMGDIRDTGIQLQYTTESAEATLAVLNDNGSRANAQNDDNRLDVMYRLVFRGVPGLHLGLAGTLGNGSTGQSKSPYKRLGLEFSWTGGAHAIEAEYARALDGSGSTVIRSRGGYLSYLYRLAPGIEVVARYDRWDPDTNSKNNVENDYTIGANWYLKGHNAKVQLNLVRKAIGADAPSFLGTSRTLLISNFQTAW